MTKSRDTADINSGTNTAVGEDALENNTGSNSTAVGSGAGGNATMTGSENNLFGYIAGRNITSGQYNTGIGSYSLNSLTTGSSNIAMGRSSLGSSTTGANNVAIGMDALVSNTTASYNTAVGYKAGYSNTTGTNDAFGTFALLQNTTGTQNVAIGKNSLENNTTANNNVAVGYRAGYLSTAQHNTFIGYGSGETVTTGQKNTILGRYDGNYGGLDIRTSSNNIVLSDGDGNPRVHITNNGRFRSPGVWDATTSASANVVVTGDQGQLERSTSSLRYKNTVNDATHGLTELLTLRPVTYKGNNDGDTVFGGLIAEEVHDAGLTEFVTYDNEGRPDALAYSNMVSLCIKAIQEQQTTITALEARIATLEG